MFGGIIGIPFQHRNSRSDDNHIPSLLDRHIFKISLTVCPRISTDIMSRKRFGPSSRLTVIENKIQHRFGNFCIIAQKQRTRRISNVDRTYRSIAITLFREEKQFPFRSFYQFMGGYRLPVSSGTNFSILLSSCPAGIFHNLFVPTITDFHGFCIIFFSICKSQFDCRKFLLPIGIEVLFKILHRFYIVISHQQMSADRFSSHTS